MKERPWGKNAAAIHAKLIEHFSCGVLTPELTPAAVQFAERT
jgi:hypothetical protein